jgi:hypothetical protein
VFFASVSLLFPCISLLNVDNLSILDVRIPFMNVLSLYLVFCLRRARKEEMSYYVLMLRFFVFCLISMSTFGPFFMVTFLWSILLYCNFYKKFQGMYIFSFLFPLSSVSMYISLCICYDVYRCLG